jgi:hypothetical protein
MKSNLKRPRGPALVKEQLLEAKPAIQKALAGTIGARERDQLEHTLASIDLWLRSQQATKPKTTLCYEIDDLTDRERVMARLAKKSGRGRNVIYHGTRCLSAVLKIGKLLPPLSGERAICFSRSAEVAAHFAFLPGHASERRHPGILVLDKGSLACSYKIEPSRYDEQSSRNEREEIIWERIVNFRRHLIAVVSDAHVTAILGVAKHPHLPRGILQWPADRRRKFTNRRIAAGYRLVKKGRARVRERIVKERERLELSSTPTRRKGSCAATE